MELESEEKTGKYCGKIWVYEEENHLIYIDLNGRVSVHEIYF